MAHGDFKNLPIGTAFKSLICDKAFDIAKNLKYDGYQRRLASMAHKLFDKRSSDLNGSGGAIESKIISD